MILWLPTRCPIMRTGIASGLLFGIALTLDASAIAQSPNAQIEVGRAIEGQLAGAETRHLISLRAGQTVRITARGRGFDALLRLYTPGSDRPIAENDDGGGGLVAELTYQAERAGRVLIGVSQSGGLTGSPGRQRTYDLTVLPASPVITRVRPISPNSDRPVRVVMQQCGERCQFTFDATEGQRLIAETTNDSDEADPLLELLRGDEVLDSDDDSGDGVNARIIRPIDRRGSYVLAARTLNGSGEFDLNVRLVRNAPRAPTGLEVGQRLTGTLNSASDVSADGRHYDAYRLHGRAGQRLVVEMEAADFDPELQAWGDTLIGRALIASNDDAEQASNLRTLSKRTDSRLEVTFAREGDIEIRAGSRNRLGSYQLQVDGQPAS